MSEEEKEKSSPKMVLTVELPKEAIVKRFGSLKEFEEQFKKLPPKEQTKVEEAIQKMRRCDLIETCEKIVSEWHFKTYCIKNFEECLFYARYEMKPREHLKRLQ